MLPIWTGFITYDYYRVPKSLYSCTVQFHGIISDNTWVTSVLCFAYKWVCKQVITTDSVSYRIQIRNTPSSRHFYQILACMSSHCFVLIFFDPHLLHENQDTLHLNMNVQNGGEGLSGRSKWWNEIKPYTHASWLGSMFQSYNHQSVKIHSEMSCL